MLDFKFLVGTLLGWRFVNQVFGRPEATTTHDAIKELQELQALIAALRQQLSQKEADLAEKDRRLTDATSKLQDTEFARLTLESHVCQVEAKVVRLEADLETQAEQLCKKVFADPGAAPHASLDSPLFCFLTHFQNSAELGKLEAANEALRRENSALHTQLAQLHPAAQAAPAADANAVWPASAEELAALRDELAFVQQQNAALQERLMDLAFQAPAEPSEGSAFSPEPRRPRHRPLAEDEEIQRRIAEASAQVRQFEEEGEQPGSPFLAAAQAQLAAYQEIKLRLSRTSASGPTAEEGEGDSTTPPEEPAVGEQPALQVSFLLSDDSGSGSPAVSRSPTGVLSVQGSVLGGLEKGAVARGATAAREYEEEEEVSSSALSR
ncbi:hypothetical protein N2152v2_000227 [Parachlorella kessleri]